MESANRYFNADFRKKYLRFLNKGHYIEHLKCKEYSKYIDILYIDILYIDLIHYIESKGKLWLAVFTRVI